jgi:inositol phosphorylceramide mannosyltransferase catalytic subunit
MPDAYVRFGEGWQRHHPDWELRLWTDADLPPLTFPEAFARCRNSGEASDVLRYELLHRLGGVYVDTDVECCRPLDPLIEDVTAFAAWARPKVIGSAVLGSVPGHPAMMAVLKRVCEEAGFGGQFGATGPGALTRVLANAKDVELFGAETFYPRDYFETAQESELQPRASRDPRQDGESAAVTYAIHHWHATWKTRENLMLRTRRLVGKVNRMKQRQREHRRRERRLRRRVRRHRQRARAARRREQELRQRLDKRPLNRMRAAISRAAKDGWTALLGRR